MDNKIKCTHETKQKMWNRISTAIDSKEKKGDSFLFRFPILISASVAAAALFMVLIFSSTGDSVRYSEEEVTKLYAYIEYEEPYFDTVIEEFLF